MIQTPLSTTQTLTQVQSNRTYIITAAGITITLPQPKFWASQQGAVFTSVVDGWTKLSAPSGYYFNTAATSILIPPYGTVDVRSIRNSSSYYYVAIGDVQRSEELISWSPTLTWTTATPTLSSASYHAWVDRGVCHFIGYIATADGAGATALTITLPLRPVDKDHYVPITCQEIVDGTDSDPLGRIDMADSTNTNRVIEFDAFSTWTDDKACSLCFSGFYEVAGFETWTNVETYGTSNWNSPTEVSRCKSLDAADGRSAAMHFITDLRTTDAKGVTSSVTITTPSHPADTGQYVPLESHDYCVAGDDSVDYDANLMTLDCDHATEASRVAVTTAVGVMANGKAAQLYCSGIYEHYGWDAFTPTLTWTAATAPTMASNSGRYTVINGMCFFHCYSASTDGNGATALVVKLEGLPTPRYLGCKTAVNAMQTVNATRTNAHGKLRTDNAADADRPYIYFDNLSTYTDSVAAKMSISGFYPV